MKIWEIKDIDSGVKIRQKHWNNGNYIYWNNIKQCFINNSGDREEDFEYGINDWEYYQKPKEPKIITLYRYTHTYLGNEIIQTNWVTIDWEKYKKNNLPSYSNYNLLKTESKEVEVEE